MAITALDIKDKQFTTKFRGYNEQEVDEFLDIIVDDYEDLVREQMKPNVLPSKQKNLNVKVVSSTNAYWLQLKVSLA